MKITGNCFAKFKTVIAKRPAAKILYWEAKTDTGLEAITGEADFHRRWVAYRSMPL